MKRVALSLAILLVVAVGISCESASRPVKLATYNVENLFDAFDDPYADDVDRYSDGALLTKPGRSVAAMCEVLKELNADVVGLQEVENRGLLEAVNRERLESLGYKHVELVEGNDGRGIDVALLSKYPLGPVVSYRHLQIRLPFTAEPGRFSRDLLEVTVRPPAARPFTVFVTHLKSRSGGREATWQREAEARKIREIMDVRLKSDSKSLFFLLGDLNDDPPSTTLAVLTGKGRTAVKPVPARDSMGKEWTQLSSYTTRYPPICFDYILASPAAYGRLKSNGILRAKEGSAAWKTQRDASDHFPVWAVFDL